MSGSNGKGEEYEFSICQLFSNQKYFTRRSIAIISSANQDITDVDVLGIKFSYPFKKEIIICDCKNKTRSKPFERILWTKGLGVFLSVDSEYVSFPRIRKDIIDFAKQCKVRVISQDDISCNSSIDRGYGDYLYYKNNLKKLIDNKDDVLFLKYYELLKKEYILNNPFVSLNVALVVVNKLTTSVFEEDKKRILFAEGISLAAYSILDICRDVFGMNSEYREQYIAHKLKYGNSDSDLLDIIIEKLTNYANGLLADKIPREHYSKDLVEIIDIPEPHYKNSCISIVEKAYNNPEWYIDLLINVDYIVYEFLIKHRKFELDEFDEFCGHYLVHEKLKTCKNIIYFVCSSAGINLYEIWKEEKDFIPDIMHS